MNNNHKKLLRDDQQISNQIKKAEKTKESEY